MPNRILIRLMEIGKKQVDLLAELENRGIHISYADLSRTLNNRICTARSDMVKETCEKIVEEWEREVQTREKA